MGAHEAGRFVPGTMLGSRYRIAGRLGKGGMGEVYRADDLRLGQPVAMKVLPLGFSQETGPLARLASEVRLARQVSHPNVCRVYDIGEAEGLHFITMEYVDGEDLASLLLRIGRLPPDKATQFSRELAAGLAAAHARGVLHRDLKPGNVMIDGKGSARIMDFGLAGLATDLSRGGSRAGTPAYMSPEQLAGGGLTERTDLFSLGLVLYEAFTGRPVYRPNSLEELRDLHAQDVPSMRTIVPEVPEIVDRVVLQCLERDPERRPPSAAAVAASLGAQAAAVPALASAEEPGGGVASPAMSITRRSLSGWASAIVAVVAMAACLLASRQARLLERAPMSHPADLQRIADEVLAAAGVPAGSNIRGVEQDPNAGTLRFWARWSAEPLVPSAIDRPLSQDEPPPGKTPGAAVLLDAQGRLLSMWSVGAASPASEGFDLRGALRIPSHAAEVEPRLAPMVPHTARYAWTWSDESRGPERAEAATLAGRPVWYESRAMNSATKPAESVNTSAFLTGLLFYAVLYGGGLWLAAGSLRLGHADVGSAVRLGLVSTACVAVGHACQLPWSASPELLSLVPSLLGGALLTAATVGVLALGTEPVFRRTWNASVAGWYQLVRGNVSDARVSREVLAGMAAGSLWAAGIAGMVAMDSRAAPLVSFAGTLNGVLPSLGEMALSIPNALLAVLLVMLGVCLARLVLRSVLPDRAILFGVLASVLTTAAWLQTGVRSADSLAPVAVFGLGFAAMVSLLYERIGLVGCVVAWFVARVLLGFPLTLETSRWYAGSGLIAAGVLLVIIIHSLSRASSDRSEQSP
jgi:serine/threonine-protein kinase